MNYKKFKNCLLIALLSTCFVNMHGAQDNDIIDRVSAWQEKNKKSIRSFLYGFLAGRFILHRSRIVDVGALCYLLYLLKDELPIEKVVDKGVQILKKTEEKYKDLVRDEKDDEHNKS